jgi:xanthine dehydrogenase YagR molybdenum-binding subunit
MRGPGAVPGLWATESAMDELALKLGMDPVQLRLVNEPKIDEGLKIPFSSRHMKECLSTGAQKFGWSKRNPRMGSMSRDGLTVGDGRLLLDRGAFRTRRERRPGSGSIQSDGPSAASRIDQHAGGQPAVEPKCV